MIKYCIMQYCISNAVFLHISTLQESNSKSGFFITRQTQKSLHMLVCDFVYTCITFTFQDNCQKDRNGWFVSKICMKKSINQGYKWIYWYCQYPYQYWFISWVKRSSTGFHILTRMRFKLTQILSFKTSYSRFNIWQFIMIPKINTYIFPV